MVCARHDQPVPLGTAGCCGHIVGEAGEGEDLSEK
jgi:hypothetical protein